MARTETRPLKFEPLASARGSTCRRPPPVKTLTSGRSEEHTSELQSRSDLVCRLLLEKKKTYVNGPGGGCGLVPVADTWRGPLRQARVSVAWHSRSVWRQSDGCASSSIPVPACADGRA